MANTTAHHPMAETLSDVLFKLVLMALAFAAASLLLRDALFIAAQVPLSPQEGWNAYLARAAQGAGPLYPQGLMINNDPPLSFYIVGLLSTVTGDPIVAGRLTSLIAFFAAAGAITVILRNLGAGVLAALFASLFFAVGFLAASNYVAMDDPQLLGHALQLAGLSLLLQQRRDVVIAALLMTAGLFVKHNLLALPLASGFWLWGRDRQDAIRFAAVIAIGCVAGLVAARIFLGVNLIAALASPRHWAMTNFVANVTPFLRWAGAALVLVPSLVWLGPRNPATKLVLSYTALALVIAALLAFCDGADMHVFFDTAIALSLSAGLLLSQMPKRWIGPATVLAAAPLALYLAAHHARANFPYSEAFAREAPLDIGFIAVHPGPALCEDLTLCFWAGKDQPVDVFGLSQEIKSGARSDQDLARLIQTGYFGSIALSSLTNFTLGPHLKSLMLRRYRVTHQDENGVFLERRVTP